MPQADFAYVPATDATDAADAAGLPLAVSVYADRLRVREELHEDVSAAGLAVRVCGPVAELLEGEARPLGELVLVDCPDVDGATLAALARMDLRAAHAGARLIVSTSVAALDDVFACCDRSGARILVDPSRAEWVIALGRVLAALPELRLREPAEANRLTLLRLTEQVGQIAERLERLDRPLPGFSGPGISGDTAFRFESPGPGYRAPCPPLPDPRLVRRIIARRQARARFFDRALFADPAWDILLDLAAARAEHARVSVTSLCIASGVPPTTALRWIGQMTEAGLLRRVEDDTDRRRVFVALTDGAAEAMARYFAEMVRGMAQVA